MIYLITGSDFDKRKKAFESLLKRFSKMETIIFDDQSFDYQDIENYLNIDQLFGGQNLFILEHVLTNPNQKDLILENLKKFKESGHIFIIVESELKALDLKKIEKLAEESLVFNKTKEVKKDFNIFSLTDVYGKRDKKNSWVMYQKALRKNVEPIEVANILIWNLKNMILVKDRKNASDEIKKTKLNPFVFKKSLSFSGNFSKEELNNNLIDLVSIYHEDRRGSDLKSDLESFILKSL